MPVNPADLRGPAKNPERTPPAPAIQTPATPAAEAADHDPIGEAAPESKSDKETPAELYAKRLKEAGISESDALHILDTVFEQGVYTEPFTFGRHRFILGTRCYDDTVRMHREIELVKPESTRTFQEIVTRHNLAGSIRQIDKDVWPHDGSDAAHDDRIARVRKLPELTVALIAADLARFDNKTFTIFSDGATALFGSPVG